jgi:hypothetical protein
LVELELLDGSSGSLIVIDIVFCTASLVLPLGLLAGLSSGLALATWDLLARWSSAESRLANDLGRFTTSTRGCK